MRFCIDHWSQLTCALWRKVFSMVPASSSLFLTSILLLVLPVLNLVSNEVDKPLAEHCSKHTKARKKNSYLWTLEDYPSVYIFGSIHRPYTSMWPRIPRNVKKAFKSSKNIYFEVDLTSPEYLLTIMKCQYLPNKQTLMDVLPPRVFNKLQNYLQYIQSQIPEWLNENEIKKTENPVFKDMTRNWQRKRPIWILLQLASFNKESVQSRSIPPLDLYMFLKGQKARKSIRHLESPEEHCGLNNLNSTKTVIYLDEILTQYNHARKEKHNHPANSNLTYHYVCGNLSNYVFSSKVNVKTSSQTSRLEALRNFEDSLTEELFLRRNKQMARKIVQEIKFERNRKNRRMFFTIGAGHLVGKGSIIELLKSKGFNPRHILATDTLPRSRQYKMNDQKYKRMKLKSSRRKKKKIAKKSFPTITPTYRETEQVTKESILLNEESIVLNVHHRSSSLNLGVHTMSNIFMTFFLSCIVRILMY